MALLTKPNMQQIWASGGDVVEPTDLKKQQGWTVEVPPHQFENWIQRRQDEYLAHVNQRGIPAWDALTEYEAGGLSYTQGSDGKIYKSVAASGPSTTTQNPTTDASDTYWTIAFADVGAFLTQAAGDARYLQILNNGSDINNITTFRTNISVYSKAESNNLVPAASTTVQGKVELATDAEAIAGTDDTRAVTPASLAATLATQPFSEVFETEELTWSSGGGVGPIAHGLGGFPKFITYEYRCITNDAGYIVGDRVYVNQPTGQSAADGLATAADATNLTGRWGGSRIGAFINKTSGSITNLTSANWRVVVKVYI